MFPDRAVDTPGHGKYVMGGFNAIQKRYLATCLIKHSMTEVENIDSKCMRVDAMTEKGEVSSFEECKSLLDTCDEIVTRGDKKHTKR